MRPTHWRERIGHFFEHDKDPEKREWIKIDGLEDAASAKAALVESMARYKNEA
ncbi:inorganic diphosphatase [Luteimonas sp. XNQY3]|nr:inorganic diphosphatase [Luteimonas sp. XNQY3]